MKTKEYYLPKEFAQKGIDALRTTTKKHIKGEYYCDVMDGYCAMGIMLFANDVNIEKLYNDNIYAKENDPFEGFVSDKENDLNARKLFTQISILNDNDGKSFSEIADWIEENVEFI